MRKSYKFDSPPKEMEILEKSTKNDWVNLDELLELIPSLQEYSIPEIRHKLQMFSVFKSYQATHTDRKLYVGNIPRDKDLTSSTLIEVLNGALKKISMHESQQDSSSQGSVVGAWISPDGLYAFIELKNPQEAEVALALNNVSIFGQKLKVGRPRFKKESPNQKGKAGQDPNSTTMLSLLGITGKAVNQNILNQPFRISPPSRVLCLKGCLNIDDLEVDEEYNEIIEDIREELEKYGTILSLKIPRPVDEKKDLPGLRNVYILYKTVEEVTKARIDIGKRLYRGRIVEACYHDELLYKQDKFDLKLKLLSPDIDINNNGLFNGKKY